MGTETRQVEMDEVALIQAARRGSLEAFNQLVLKHQDSIYNQALFLLADAMAAEDLAQGAFLQAYRRLASFRGGSFRAWILRIVTNACYDELRRRKRRPSLSLAVADEDGEEIEEDRWREARRRAWPASPPNPPAGDEPGLAQALAGEGALPAGLTWGRRCSPAISSVSTASTICSTSCWTPNFSSSSRTRSS